MTREERHKAIVRRRIFVSFCVIVLAAVAALIIYAARAVFTPDGEDKNIDFNRPFHIRTSSMDIA